MYVHIPVYIYIYIYIHTYIIYIYQITIALAPINIIVVTRKKVTMYKENEVNCGNGFRYIRRKRLASGSAESSSPREGDEARTSFLFLRGGQLNTLITFPHLQRVVRATVHVNMGLVWSLSPRTRGPI